MSGTVKQTMMINAPAAVAWDAINDVGQLHIRVAPGMRLATFKKHLEGQVRG
jgi:hypothetical protein